MVTWGVWLAAGCGAALSVAVPVAPLAAPIAPRPAAAQTAFVDGRASAAASVVAVVPEIGQARLPITVGLATAAYRGQTGTAEATTAQLGLIGTVLTLSICGGDPLLRPEHLPAALHIDSIGGEASDQRSLTGSSASGGPGAGLAFAGIETVSARPGAFASSEAAPADLDLAGLLRIRGRATAEAELVPGDHRRARAVSEVTSIDLAGGLVTIEGLRWQADQRTGADGTVAEASGSFSIARLVVAGIPLPVGDGAALQAAVDLANTVLEPLLGRISLPTTTVDEAGTVTVSPLSVRLSGGVITSTLLTPLLGDGIGITLRRGIADLLLFGGCEPGVKGTPLQQVGGAATTVLDVVIGSILGGGGVSLELGGVRATSDATTVGSAFGPTTDDDGSGGGGAVPPAQDGAATSVPRLPATTPPSAGDGDGESVAAPPTAPVDGGGSGPLLVRCITSHPSGDPGCDLGRGELAAGLGAIVVVGLVAADIVRSRRRTKAAVEAET